jgi:hypothetical protein
MALPWGGGGGRDYGMVAISFGPFDTLFKFQLINSKHKIIKIWNSDEQFSKLKIKYE